MILRALRGADADQFAWQVPSKKQLLALTDKVDLTNVSPLLGSMEEKTWRAGESKGKLQDKNLGENQFY